jgi:hypothetical protein
MSNVFEGQPDARQSEMVTEKMSRFRPVCRALSLEEKQLHDEIKASYEQVEKLIDKLPAGRYRALAYTALEESCMWGIKCLTDNHG